MNSHSFSFWALFIQADWIIKGVVLSLIGASVVSWGIIFSKLMILRRLNREARASVFSFGEAPLDKPSEGRPPFEGPFSQMLAISGREWQRLRSLTSLEHQQVALQRLKQLLTIHIDQQKEALLTQMGTLASVGSTAPFVGLLGTVWGMINSFQELTHVTGNPSLATVAPGIAEALFTTAIGLIVAIPAVIAYNRLTADIQSYEARLHTFSQQLLASCSRV